MDVKSLCSPEQFHFGWVYTFSVQLNSLQNWLQASSSSKTVWNILQAPLFDCIICYPISHATFFHSPSVSLSVLVGTPDTITVLFLGVSADCLFWKCENE